MAVAGWTEQLTGTWSGSETTTISMTANNKTGILTRDANDDIKDFVFTTGVTLAKDRNEGGGLIFRESDDASEFLYLCFRVNSSGQAFFYLQQDTLVLGDNVINSIIFPTNTFLYTTLQLTLTVSGTQIDLSITDGSGVVHEFNTNTSINNQAGDIGYGTINSWDSTGYHSWQFGSIVDTGGGPRRRVMIIS